MEKDYYKFGYQQFMMGVDIESSQVEMGTQLAKEKHIENVSFQQRKSFCVN